jgi:hypothetical protein
MSTKVLLEREAVAVTYVVLIIIAALLLGGLWYVRGRRA